MTEPNPWGDGGHSTGHLHYDLLLDLHRHQMFQSGMMGELKAIAEATERRVLLLEEVLHDSKKSRRSLGEFVALAGKIGPWLVPIVLFIRATFGQVPWSQVFEALSKLGGGGIAH